MKQNVGNVDRAIRIIAGAVILSLAFVGPRTSWAYLGIVPLATGLMGWCPPYALLGFSTCGKAGSCSTRTDSEIAAGSSCCEGK